jgi:DNA helicase II / ATP-dependent DNA helicase PcrA
MRYIKPEEWTPIDNIVLESAAEEVVFEVRHNCCVIAGPGAGKTELLAQRASFLLQTGACASPQRILALSFKRDARKAIADRVKSRVSKDLAQRFDSMTYAGFAKSIVDRFVFALPDSYRPSPGYESIGNIINIYEHLFNRKADSRTKNALKKYFVIDINALPIEDDTKLNKRIRQIWLKMLKGDEQAPSYLTFPMIAVLAEYLIQLNPKIQRAFSATYSHIFLDEFQDTTGAQYRLVKSCFANGPVLTAVGDKKQCIMGWAGARENIFEDFQRDFEAEKKTLLLNHRSVPRLIFLQKVFMQEIWGYDLLDSIETARQGFGEGEAQIWLFNDPNQEAAYTATTIKRWLEDEGLKPSDICVIVRQLPGNYGESLISALESLGLMARNENEYQDLLAEDCSEIILDFVLLCFAHRAPDAIDHVMQLMNRLAGIDASYENHEDFRNQDDELKEMLTELGRKLEAVADVEQLEEVCWGILEFLDLAAFKNLFPQYSQGGYLNGLLKDLSSILWSEYQKYEQWKKAVESVRGEYSVPVMSIHKSKGLEYDTVIFLGLEDAAFWNFENEQESENCAFFVALSRAKRRVVFTYSNYRNTGWGGKIVPQTRKGIKSLYDILENSGCIDILPREIENEHRRER